MEGPVSRWPSAARVSPDRCRPAPESGQGRRRQAATPARAGPITTRIFEEFAAGRGLVAIAEALTRGGVPCPSAHDAARNRHRSGLAWSKSAVRAN
jgi:site-specific DNA recombinase